LWNRAGVGFFSGGITGEFSFVPVYILSEEIEIELWPYSV
jgi:hypothetical protein